jgi:O-antigen ligase
MLSKIDLRHYLTIALSIVVFTTPLGILTIKGWAGYHLFICALLSLMLLWINRQNATKLELADISQIRVIAWILALPFLATLAAQLLRNEINLPALDSPARFIIAIPILYGLMASKINIERILVIAIPLGVIATYLLIPYLPQKGWALDVNRLATYSVDPLTFGKIALGFSLMAALIAIESIHKKLIFVIAIFGIILGIHMSIESQSRTGWLSVFLIILFLVIHLFRKTDSIKKKVIGSVILSIFLITPFLTNPQVLNRISQAVHEIKVWQPGKDNADTSVGMRLSFWKIGTQLFIEKPITGWGNDGFKERLAQPDFREMASQYTRDFTLSAGFHSDLMQNAVRSGIGGLIAYLSIFLAPLAFFINFYIKNQSSRLISGLGIAYVCVELISSLSTEVLSLKSTTSFYGLMIVFLLAGSFNMKNQRAKQI